MKAVRSRNIFSVVTFAGFVSGGALLYSQASYASEEQAQSFTYEGRMYTPDGATPLTDVVNFKFQILNQNSTGNPVNDCVLYEETQNNINLAPTSGVFTLLVGSAKGATARTASDANLTMAEVFRNNGSVVAPAGVCPLGGYSPSSGSSRRLRVTVTSLTRGVTETLSPDLVIGSVPQALVAETLQGLGPLDFLRKDPVTTALLAPLTLQSWTSGTRPASPSAGMTGFNTSTGFTETYDGTTWVDFSAGSGGGGGITSINGDTTAAQTLNVGTSGTDFAVANSGATHTFNLPTASATNRGALSSADWTTFNSKVDGKANLTAGGATAGVLLKTSAAGTASEATGINTSTVADVSQLQIKAGTSQAATHLQEWQNNAGTALAFMSSTGYLTLAGAPTGASEAATKGYVDSVTSTAAGSYLTKDGATQLTGAWNAGAQAVSNISTLSVGTNTAPTGGVATFNGNVGIGTASPAATIEIFKSASGLPASSGTTSNAHLRMSVPSLTTTNALDAGISTSGPWLQAVDRDNLATNRSLLLNPNGGNVGIGTTTPNAVFDTRVSAGSGGLHIGFDEAPAGWVRVGAYNDGRGAYQPMVFDASKFNFSYGNVGIGTTGPNEKLEVNGNIRLTPLNGGGTTTATIDNNGNIIRTPSDERLKTHIEPLEGSLERILKVQGVSYYWKNQESFGSAKDIGFIAQDLEKVVPEVVRQSQDPEHRRSVSYANMVALLVEALKEMYQDISLEFASLRNENASLKSDNIELKSKSAELETEVTALKSWACSQTPRPTFCK